jgi:protein tyrosine phosphatase (PTP) superfamily phosphohydrolase (DUF442 family)
MMFTQIYNFLQLSINLFAAGMPTAEQLRDAPNHGVQVVINLAPHDAKNALENEAELVKSLGMKYINIPVVWSAPTKENLDKFMNAMDEHRGKTIFVHCEANYRASAFVAIYRIVRSGWKEENAFAPMRKIWGDDDYPVWKTFIENAVRRIS